MVFQSWYQNTKSLEDMVITALKAESEIKGMLVNTVNELPVTVEEIKVKSETKDFIKKKKGQVRFKEGNKADLPGYNNYFICDKILMYAERVVLPLSLQKRIQSEFYSGPPGMSRMQSLTRFYVLARYGQRYRRDREKL